MYDPTKLIITIQENHTFKEESDMREGIVYKKNSKKYLKENIMITSSSAWDL